MKTSKITIALFVTLIVSMTISAQLKLDSYGKVGIGVTPSSSYKLRVHNPIQIYNGIYPSIVIVGASNELILRPSNNLTCKVGQSNIAFKYMYSDYFINVSDIRLKENIRDVDNALDIVLKLKGVKYDLKKEFITDEILSEEMEIDRKDRYGFLAQDVNKIYPYAVSYDDSTDIYGIDYTKFVPILVEAIKEQNEKIKLLEEELEKEKDLQAKSISIEESPDLNFDSEIKPFLGNNTPNPFDQATEIEFYLPQDISNANFYIYDLQGKQMMKFEVVEREYGSIFIQGSQLMPGMYYYSLIADSQVIGTKQMILTD